jgi:Tol biopolymer transport system component/cell wall-associated NlpC family hydrolase
MKRLVFLLLLALLLTVQPALAQTSAPPSDPAATGTLISAAPGGSPANAAAGSAALSADGNYAAFVSTAGNLVPGSAAGVAQVYLRDRTSSTTERLSQTAEGDPGNGWSYQPAISADGRVVAFTSLADNLVPGAAPIANVYAYDRSLGAIMLVSQSSAGEAADGWSEWPAVSADGRFVVFMSVGSNLQSEAAPNSDPGIYLRDLLFGTTQRLPSPAAPSGWPYRPTISADGRWVAYLWIQASTELNSAPDNNSLLVYDRLTGVLQTVPTSPGIWIAPNPPQLSADGAWLAYVVWEGPPQKPYASLYLYDLRGSQAKRVPGSQVASAHGLQYALAPDGRSLFFTLATDAGETLYRRFDLQSGQGQAIQPDRFSPAILPGGKLAIDQAGLGLVYPGQSAGAPPQLYEISLTASAAQPAPGFASGWVSDGLGHPMAGVQVSDNQGHSAWSAPDGSFRIDGLQTRTISLKPEKKGYTFSPPEFSVPINLVAATGLEFTASTDKIVEEARKDLGMPYDVQRGCPSPFKPCDGPYHGFYSGDCTDLVIDAYLASLDFNIQIALERDASQHPDHYYRWRNARSVQDMYRYFIYTQQLLPHRQPYLPGDIVFFDWEGDGVVDHVALISEVSASGRPRRMLDATGVTNDNPSGLAADLEWKALQAQHVLGHARWLGQGTQKNQAAAAPQPYLLVALDSSQAGLRLLDTSGLATGPRQSQLAGSSYLNTGNGVLVSLSLGAQENGIYFIELTGPLAAPYQLGIELSQAGEISSVYSFQDQIKTGESILIPIQFLQNNGKLVFRLPTLPGEPGPPGTPAAP